MDASKTTDRGVRGFWPLIGTQFQGAFNDNLFRYLIVYYLISLLAKDMATGVVDEGMSAQIASLATRLFSIPFIIFPGLFGAISDRYSKQRVTVWSKYIEIVIMCIGMMAFYSASPKFLYVLLFCMLTQSALFSPSKYGILPEILPESQLSWGNGVLHMWTMVAIIAGTALAGPLCDILQRGVGGVVIVGAVLVALSVAGTVSSHYIARPAAANPSKRIPFNPWSGTSPILKLFWSDRLLLMTVVAYTYFWFAGMLLQQNLVTFGVATLELSNSQSSLTLACLALGIGLGSLSAGYMSRGKIEVGLMPLGALGLACFGAVLAMPGLEFSSCFMPLFGLGFSGGIFYVPMAATLQYRSPKEARGGVIATANVLTATGMFSAGWLYGLMGRAEIGTRAVFFISAMLSLGVALFICFKVPVFLLRTALWLLASTLYRVRVMGRDNIIEEGGALLHGNHTSFLDALAILHSTDRDLHFIMSDAYCDSRGLRPLARLMKVERFEPAVAEGGVSASFQSAVKAVKAGKLVCVFAEDHMTRGDQLRAFGDALAQAGMDKDATVIPFCLDAVWTSVFKWENGRYSLKMPDQIPNRLDINYGAPVPAVTSAYALRKAINALGVEAWTSRKLDFQLLHRAFVSWARRRPWATAVADLRTGALTYLKTLVGSIILGRKLRVLLDDKQMVGILLPPSVGGALTNIALQLMGKSPVNLNYTAPADIIEASFEQCSARHCITARAFLERFPVTVPGEAVYLEDIMKSVMKKDRAIGLVLAFLCPVRLLERMLGGPRKRSSEDLATVIFSSGSEGEPKGVMLSHRNCMKDIEPMVRIFAHSHDIAMMGVLPFFHSFGFTVTLWLPLTNGIRGVYHPNPLEARAIGRLVKKFKAMFLIGTPTFLQNFTRRCSRDQFSTLEYVICGAEKMPPHLRDAFIDRFGTEPVEGYGTTECAPVVSTNMPDFITPGLYQINNKRGSIGRPLPGMSVRVVDPDTGEELGADESGMLEIKGPNVMEGYLNMPEKTASVLKDGWYSSGDIASVDEDAFITITDRLARFSKIAGEMVAHTRVEDTLHGLLELTEQSLVVTGLPDEMKGERLVVLHTLDEGRLEALIGRLDTANLPNLWLPRPSAFYRIDAIPILGTGKMDLKAIKLLAREVNGGV